jgi:hypothetical protein
LGVAKISWVLRGFYSFIDVSSKFVGILSILGEWAFVFNQLIGVASLLFRVNTRAFSDFPLFEKFRGVADFKVVSALDTSWGCLFRR